NDPLPANLPPMQVFSSPVSQKVSRRSNQDLTRDFLELTFEMESGKKIGRLTRFDTPVTIALAAAGSPVFEADLAALIARFKSEARLNVKLGKTGQPANIVIETLPRRVLQKTVPNAACFVVPRVKDWEDFRKNRRTGVLDWSTLERRERATVFIPDDVSPQEARDCLHEEIAQALGPLNDIYRLPDSVFNDDNLNTILTGFDMLILRIYYDPQLKNGMSRAEVANALPAILKRLNPAGETAPKDGLEKTERLWIDTIETALGPRVSQSRRLASARRAVDLSRENKWFDNRLGFSLFALGKLSLGLRPELATESFLRAYTVYSELYGVDDIHTAHVALQLAAFSLSSGNSEATLKFINDSLPSVSRGQNASLLATFLMIKAEALEFDGRREQATTVRLDSLGWARYGFASEQEIRARLREIAALRPRQKKPGV
ncbi:MAG: DUF2927 domain-containing protein, partial [Alphaproteobacteria bacterium]|nr:DUF2927 domain-containing protein [Alphaproteobacteria bacterium]